MDNYHKPTDTRRCLPFSSNHPSHCRRNIPFSLARRVFTICENKQELEKELEDLKINLQKHGYPESLIINGFKKASMIPKEDLRRPKTKNEENILAFITTENPNNPNVFPLVRNSIDTLIR